MRFFPVLILSACYPSFESVEAACPDSATGDGSAMSVDSVWRQNCHRRVARTSVANVAPLIEDAVEAHADYLAANFDPLNPEGYVLGQEVVGNAGFTGVDTYDRLVAAGWDEEELNYLGIWFVEDAYDASEVPDPEDLIDEWITIPYLRQALLQPDEVGTAYAESDGWIVYTLLYEFPAQEHIERPLVYPADGQQDVPLSYTDPGYADPVPDLTEVGFPITVTVSSGQERTSWWSRNPYGLSVRSASLSGPSGEVDLYTIAPGSYDALAATASFVPTQPLSSGQEYTFTALIAWNGSEGDTEISATFTTE